MEQFSIQDHSENMFAFNGIDKSQLDTNGRIKLSPRILGDFAKSGNNVVLHCLPEGALAVYPEEIFLQMRNEKSDAARRAANSLLFRRELRRFNAWSTPAVISPQGRITIPGEYREFAALAVSENVMVVGVEIGVEIWNCERWKQEQECVMNHAVEKGENEMIGDLNSPLCNCNPPEGRSSL